MNNLKQIKLAVKSLYLKDKTNQTIMDITVKTIEIVKISVLELH